LVAAIEVARTEKLLSAGSQPRLRALEAFKINLFEFPPMFLRAGFKITYELPAPAAMTLMLSIRPEREPDLVTAQVIRSSSTALLRRFIDGFGNACTVVDAPAGLITLSSDFLIYDSRGWDEVDPAALQHPVNDLPEEVLVYLLGSRYCETDHFHDLAWRNFGAIEGGWNRVQAIVDYVQQKITFGYEHARPTKTAGEAHTEGQGVCRDFAHLAITLCRSMNIPARYCTGFLPDIGVPVDPAPMDFCAWFEVYLGGRWITFDARHNRPRSSRILMAIGRDATDVALTTTFGTAWLRGFEVVAEEAHFPAAVA
jgi:transglutaminase-like putative cysteine protease